MATIFIVCRWKNFLSTGNNFTEVELNKHKTTLVVGTNGTGKSTLLDALSFCLYNKPFRNINKPQLLNSITQKHLVVEVEFEIGGREYLVRRGMRPAVFEIYQDGVLLNQVADNKDYQETLEKGILKMNQKSFRQTVVLGSANFVPFMQLPPHTRREVIEDLLDIQIFSLMNTILRDKITKNRSDLLEVDHQITLHEKMIKMHEAHMAELHQNNKELIEAKINKIDEFNRENSLLLIQVDAAQSQIETLKDEIANAALVKERMEEAHSLQTRLLSKKKRLEKEIVFYSTELSCPTCKQEISSSFKDDKLGTKRSASERVSANLLVLDTKIQQLAEKIDEFERTEGWISKFNQSVTELNTKINSNNRLISSMQKDVKELEEKTKIMVEEKTSNVDLLHHVKEARKKKYALLRERDILSNASNLLKDGGIKTLIIRQYIPVINKLINKYLAHMDFFVQFQLDESFKETILSRHRDDFSYDSFSQGEKFRIDLALLFAWRTIARMKNSSSTNLLIFDEIMDSALDNQGTEDFLKILNSLTQDNNTVIISHKVDQMVDKFDHVIRFEKIKNFSRIANA